MGYSVPIVRRPDPKAELGYVCPECKQWAPVGLWKETEVSCELCGDHSAKQCPLCEEGVDTVYSGFEDPDDFLLKAEAEKAGRASGFASPEEQIGVLKQFLDIADKRANRAKSAAEAARQETGAMRMAWLQAVGSRIQSKPDIVTALSEATTDMRRRLDALDEAQAASRLAAMEAEYGPFMPLPTIEEA